MSDTKALRIVALLFLINAIEATIEMAHEYSPANFTFEFGILGFFICPGILSLSRFWRIIGLILLWIVMLVIPMMFVFTVASGDAAYYIGLHNFNFFEVPKIICLAWLAFGWLIDVWQYRVLTRPSIRAEFYESRTAA